MWSKTQIIGLDSPVYTFTYYLFIYFGGGGGEMANDREVL